MTDPALRAWDARAALLQPAHGGQSSNTTTFCGRLVQACSCPLNKEFANNKLKKKKERTEKVLSKSTTVCSINDVYSTTSKSPCALFILKEKIGFKKITVHSLGKQLQAEVNYLQEVCKLIENRVYNTNNALSLAVKEYFTNAVPWQQSQHEHLRGNYSSFL